MTKTRATRKRVNDVPPFSPRIGTCTENALSRVVLRVSPCQNSRKEPVASIPRASCAMATQSTRGLLSGQKSISTAKLLCASFSPLCGKGGRCTSVQFTRRADLSHSTVYQRRLYALENVTLLIYRSSHTTTVIRHHHKRSQGCLLNQTQEAVPQQHHSTPLVARLAALASSVLGEARASSLLMLPQPPIRVVIVLQR